MPKMERIFIRIDPQTGAVLRHWFTAQGTTLAGAIQDFLMDEYEKALAAEPDSDESDDTELDAKIDAVANAGKDPEEDIAVDTFEDPEEVGGTDVALDGEV